MIFRSIFQLSLCLHIFEYFTTIYYVEIGGLTMPMITVKDVLNKTKMIIIIHWLWQMFIMKTFVFIIKWLPLIFFMSFLIEPTLCQCPLMVTLLFENHFILFLFGLFFLEVTTLNKIFQRAKKKQKYLENFNKNRNWRT